MLLGDERDSPRGRIVLMKDMLEKGGAPTKEQVYHIDRCLSCLNCKTACPSSVNYQRLVDQARAHIQEHYQPPAGRPAAALDHRQGDDPAEAGAHRSAAGPYRRAACAPAAGPAGRHGADRPDRRGRKGPSRRISPSPRSVKQRIAIMPGCVQGALAPQIDAAVGRVLARRGIELVALEGAGCCGALPHHMGREA